MADLRGMLHMARRTFVSPEVERIAIDANGIPEFRPRIREVHRCGWLSTIRRDGDHQSAFPFASHFGMNGPQKTREARWVIFCIHDDSYPYLEFYNDPKKSPNHKPESYVLLRPCLHISRCIIPLEGEELRYPFVVALLDEVIELGAENRQAMLEWVECMKNKLTELKILAPRNNIYSCEPKAPLLLPASRNPSSPLPPCPDGHTAIPPGVEVRSRSERRSLRDDLHRRGNEPPPLETTQQTENYPDVSNDEYLAVWSSPRPASSSSSSTSGEVPSSFLLNGNHPDQGVSSGDAQSGSEQVVPLAAARALTSTTSAEPRADPPDHEVTFGVLRRHASLNVADVTASGDNLTPPPLPLRPVSIRPLPPIPVPRPPPRPREEVHPVQRTMKEEQVEEFQRQQKALIMKARIPLPDCCGTIALVDSFNSVWVAGWKQKDHPILNYYFHIGDQVKSINGVSVTSSSQAQRLLKASNSPEVEIQFRRVPRGEIVLLKRSQPGDSLGFVREGNSAVIKDVIDDGLACRHGLPPKARTMDGLSLTQWVLTEVNGRPLNLFFKGQEVEDRLNAVGQEISLLVQPLDLVNSIKRLLKLMRSYKDYIVQ